MIKVSWRWKVLWCGRKINKHSWVFFIIVPVYWVTVALLTGYQFRALCVRLRMYSLTSLSQNRHMETPPSSVSLSHSLLWLGRRVEVLTSCQGIGAIDCDLSGCLYLNPGFNLHRSTCTLKSARCSTLPSTNGAKWLCDCVCLFLCVCVTCPSGSMPSKRK